MLAPHVCKPQVCAPTYQHYPYNIYGLAQAIRGRS
ncbi:hypothetical protein MY10362_008281 [Beauveria mimosiformis]